MSQQYDIMKDVLNEITKAFAPKDNGYELRRFQINGGIIHINNKPRQIRVIASFAETKAIAPSSR